MNYDTSACTVDIPIHWLCRAKTDYVFGQGNVVPSLGSSENDHIVLGNDVERAFIVANQQKITLTYTGNGRISDYNFT